MTEKSLWNEVKPVDTESTASTSEDASTVSTTATAKAATEKAQRKNKAMSIIVSSILASVSVYVEDETDPREMWKILRDRYAPKTKTVLRQLVREFMTTKMMEDTELETHLQQMQCLKRQIKEQGMQVPEPIYVEMNVRELLS